ncbi:hypothetical protein [Mesorhizobium sp. M2A.F.Ca.ET.043.05.1.1]|uniref:hypothetical protein n=1 Tax=Mesorhizobium sp. M2A.F.Ca.ET.043.05.1.1 TaxID=2493671 RepID=UPI0032B1023F
MRTGTDRRTAELSPALPAASYLTYFRKQAIHRRWTDRQQLVAKFAIQIEPAMPLKSPQQNGNQRFQPFRAKAIGRLPQCHQRLQNFGAIKHRILSGGRGTGSARSQHPDRMFAMIAGNCDELVQNPLLVGPAARSISLDNCFNQFQLCRHANPPRHPASESG